ATQRNITLLRLGDATATGLGVNVTATRVIAIIAAVALIAVATAACGPVAFVAFVSGPLAMRLLGPRGPPVLAASLGSALVFRTVDQAGQYLLGTRYPVGVIPGALGAPFLIYMLIRSNREAG